MYFENKEFVRSKIVSYNSKLRIYKSLVSHYRPRALGLRHVKEEQIGSKTFEGSIMTVSYTHLDVYKRQL